MKRNRSGMWLRPWILYLLFRLSCSWALYIAAFAQGKRLQPMESFSFPKMPTSLIKLLVWTSWQESSVCQLVSLQFQVSNRLYCKISSWCQVGIISSGALLLTFEVSVRNISRLLPFFSLYIYTCCDKGSCLCIHFMCNSTLANLFMNYDSMGTEILNGFMACFVRQRI